MTLFQVENENSYKIAMDNIADLSVKHGLDPMYKQDIEKLYDSYYWLLRELARMNMLLADVCNKIADEAPLIVDGREGLSALIPASYKPIRPLEALKEYHVSEDE